MSREELLRTEALAHLVDAAEREVGARVVDLAGQAAAAGEPKATDFLDPREREIAESVAVRLSGIRFFAAGGYPRAERRRLVLYPEYLLDELIAAPVAAVAIDCRPGTAPAGHRDYLGALLGLGLDHGNIGDVIVHGEGCHALVASEVLGFVLAHLERVGPQRVSVQEIDPERLVAAQSVKEIRATVASLRLDAVASTGFGTSRTRMAREIRAQRVKVNRELERDAARGVKEGDVISIRGRGRVVVERVSGLTKRGRVGVELKRLL